MDRLGKTIMDAFPGAKAKPGFADEEAELNIFPALEAAKKMEKKIKDQLHESDAMNHICKALFECTLLGTGVVKGPFLVKKEIPRWNSEGVYEPVIKNAPMIEFVSIWDIYPDPNATSPSDLDYVIQRHRLTRQQMRALKKRTFFRDSAIDRAIEAGVSQEFDQWWEDQLNESSREGENNRYEVLEYWGSVTREMMEETLEEKLPSEFDDMEEFDANIWVSNGQVLRAILNPFKPRRIPFFLFQYEQDLYNFFGVGVAENMQDAQTLMNGFVRLAIDNAVLASSIMLEVDESTLTPGQTFEIYPGKVWRRQGGAPGQSIFATKFNSTANETMQMFDRFRVLADEATGIPSFSHGQTGVSGIGRTASGISMLLGAASLNTKTVIKNVDNNLLQPLGEAMFAFNMQFDFDERLVGDLEIKARGTSSLIQKELKSQRLLQLMQIVQNPAFLAFANIQEIFKEYLATLDLDPDKYTLDPKRAAIQTALIQTATAAVNAATGAQAQGQPAPTDNGGGNIGIPNETAAPGQAEFSGNAQGGGSEPTG